MVETEKRTHYMATDNIMEGEFSLEVDELAEIIRRAGSRKPQVEVDAPKTPEPEASLRIGAYEITFPKSESDQAKPSQSAAKPKDDLLDLYSEREARHRGEVSEKEIEEARPETPYEPLADYRYWEQVYAARDADAKGKPLPQWTPCASSASPQEEINPYAENSQRRAREAIGEKCDEAETKAHQDLMAWAAKRKAENK